MNLLLQISEPSRPSSNIGVRDLKLPLRCNLDIQSCGMLHGIGWQTPI